MNIIGKRKKDTKKSVAYDCYSARQLTRKETFKYFAVSVCGLAAVGYLFFDNVVAMIVLALFSIPGKEYYRQLRANKISDVFADSFKDVLLSLSASFQTGRQMREALIEARDNLLMVYPKDSQVNVELGQIVKRITLGGESEREVLFDLARRSENEDVMSFADIYYTCLTTGGDIVKVTCKTADVLIEKITIRREIDMLTAQKKYEANLLTGMPVLVILMLKLNSPDYLAPLYGNPFGVAVMSAALIAIIVSFVWAGKIMRIEV